MPGVSTGLKVSGVSSAGVLGCGRKGDVGGVSLLRAVNVLPMLTDGEVHEACVVSCRVKGVDWLAAVVWTRASRVADDGGVAEAAAIGT